MPTITAITTRDARYDLPPGEGSDAVHRNPVYAYAVTQLASDSQHIGVGLAFTLGKGNDLVCGAIESLGQRLVGQNIEQLMSRWGQVSRGIADDEHFRWLGPHKGVVHLALASITNACFDLWAKSRGVPLWKLLLDLDDQAVVNLLDLSYLEDALTADQGLDLLAAHRPTRDQRIGVIGTGYPGYDTSIGWFNYSDDLIVENVRKALDAGFTAMKLKVGSTDIDRDVRRAGLIRRAVGDRVRLMVDANQQWTLPVALEACRRLADAAQPYWIEEPTHPDDVLGHQTLARAVAPTAIAAGEHIPHRVLFKNFMQAQAIGFVQVDAVRVAGVSEFLTVSLMARRFGLHVAPHVGDMGQLHQHLVLFNHVAMGHQRLFLEHIPHLRRHFVHPARVTAGVYHTPQEPGSGCDLVV